MSDFIQFTEGSNYITQNGWPTTVWFLLLSVPVGTLTIGATLATLPEITGTGYSRMAQALPTVTGGALVFTQMTWANGVNIDWPHSVYGIAAATTSNNTGVALCAWNLQTNGVPRDLSNPNTFEEVSPIYVN